MGAARAVAVVRLVALGHLGDDARVAAGRGLALEVAAVVVVVGAHVAGLLGALALVLERLDDRALHDL